MISWIASRLTPCARVRFYPVDVRRLEAAAPSPTGFGASRSARQDSQDGLITLARETGGRAILNSNNLGEVFEAVNRDNAEFYVLGYYPKKVSQQARFRKIRVEVSRPGVKLEYRKGYFEQQDFSRMSQQEKRLQLRQALEWEAPQTDLPLTARFELFLGLDGVPRLAYGIGIHPRDLPVEGKGESVSMAFTVAAAAYPEDGEGGAFEQRRLDLRLDAAAFERMRDNPWSRLHYSSEMRLDPGPYRWRAVVRDENTGRFGTYRAHVTAPDFRQPGAASTILLTSRVEAIPQQGRKKAPPAAVDVEGYRFLPSSEPVFQQGEPLHLLYDLYNLSSGEAASPAGARLALFADGRRIEPLPVAAYEASPDAELRRVRYRAALDTAALAPGDYLLVAQLPGGGAGEMRAIYRKFTLVGAP